MKQNLNFAFPLSCIILYALILSSCFETASSTQVIATSTFNYKTGILTPEAVFSLPELIEWKTPNSGDFCEHIPTPQVVSNPNHFSSLSGRFVLCIYERSFTAMDLDKGRLVLTNDKKGDIVLFNSRWGTNENPSYGISSWNNAFVNNAYTIESYANHSGVNNLSYEYCESILQNQTGIGGMSAEVNGIACVKTTEGKITLLRVEKIYPATTLSVEFSFAILRNE